MVDDGGVSKSNKVAELELVELTDEGSKNKEFKSSEAAGAAGGGE